MHGQRNARLVALQHDRVKNDRVKRLLFRVAFIAGLVWYLI